jgi:hypothetical protein
MANSVSITINDLSGDTQANVVQKLTAGVHGQSKMSFISELIRQLAKIGGGSKMAKVWADISSSNLLAATGTVTMASAAAADTVTLNGVVFTAVTGAVTGVAASTSWSIDGTDTAAATSFCQSINFGASGVALVKEFFSAVNTAGVVTLYAKPRGVVGNAFTLASSHNTRLAVSGARLTGGLGGQSYGGPTGFVFGASGAVTGL